MSGAMCQRPNRMVQSLAGHHLVAHLAPLYLCESLVRSLPEAVSKTAARRGRRQSASCSLKETSADTRLKGCQRPCHCRNVAIDERPQRGCRPQEWSLAQAVRRDGPPWSNCSTKWNGDFHSIALCRIGRKNYQIKQPTKTVDPDDEAAPVRGDAGSHRQQSSERRNASWQPGRPIQASTPPPAWP
jgi:hypothetical protein